MKGRKEITRQNLESLNNNNPNNPKKKKLKAMKDDTSYSEIFN